MRTADSYRAARRNAARSAAKTPEAKAAGKTFRDFFPGFAAKTVEPTLSRFKYDHPGANPQHDTAGRKRWTAKVLDPATKELVDVKMRGPRNPSRWLPHSSNSEAERRLARMG